MMRRWFPKVRETEAEKEDRTIVWLSNRGQVTLPASIRKALDLASGDAFEVHLEDGRVVLEPVEVIATERYTDERVTRVDHLPHRPVGKIIDGKSSR